ncbi:hypothetical protein CK501_15415 [Halovibrio salipaludis]|uniref:Uncharacterized protein n=1 Tax=Halovibrio salipaludis TaxID=2032626 RepID=A0A2A2EV44_9GAMM|nr:hypothetical protein CK501_15415 [Halovibrio salipaludis]
MIDESNPAGRLHRILSEVATKNGDGICVRDVWAPVFGCSPKDEASVLRGLVEVYGLCEEVKNLIKLNPDLNHDLYLASFPKIEKAILPVNLGQQWKALRSNLDGEVLARLQFCAEALQGFYSEEAISEEDVSQIHEMVSALSDAITDSSISPELKLALLEELDRIQKAIVLIKIKGAKGLKEALQSLVGSVVANHQSLKQLETDEPDILERLGGLLDKLDAFTARALKLKRMLTGPVSYVLDKITGPDGEEEPVEDD